MKLTDTQVECMQEAALELQAEALVSIRERYDKEHKFHVSEHSLCVIKSADKIARLALERGKIKPYQVPLIGIAAAFLDYWFNIIDKRDNEKLSAESAVKEMQRFNCFELSHYNEVSGLIVATSVREFFPRIIQSADPNNNPQKVLCDADLSQFGMQPEEFIKWADMYKDELRLTGRVTDMGYWQFEETILGNHVWWMPETAEIFPHLADNVQAAIAQQHNYAVQ